MREYLKVTPTSETLELDGIPRILESLHKVATGETTGLGERLNPLHSKTPPRFEFLALSGGADEPVEFFYGGDDHLDTLETRLCSIYPETFDVERVDLNIATRLIPPVEFTRSEFIERYEKGALQYEFSPDGEAEPMEGQKRSPEDTAGASSSGGSTDAVDSSTDYSIEVSDTSLPLAPPADIPNERALTRLEKPTETQEETILARPAVDTVSPVSVRWCGSAERKKDWMTSLRPLTSNDEGVDRFGSVDKPGTTLTSLIEHLAEATSPVAFQVVFEPRESWKTEAEIRTGDLADGQDTLFQKFVAAPFEGQKEATKSGEKNVSESAAKRIEAIDAKNHKHTFTTNIRAVGIPSDEETRDDLVRRMDSLRAEFDTIHGPYYEVVGERLRNKGVLSRIRKKTARHALKRLVDREITTGGRKKRPNFVLDGAELANFVLVPSSEHLSVEGTRGTRAEQQSRNPLPRPNPDLIRQFREGMALGYALDENGVPQSEPIRLPPKLLTTHYARFASTGAGKSTGGNNEGLSLRETTSGPVVIVDAKGDGMCENYLRSHHVRFGGLDDVYLFRVPDIVPALSFFDIRPALEAGQSREAAIQDKNDHFDQILRMVMGRELYDQAPVAKNIISWLIKALFDAEYGSDVFGLDDFFEAVLKMQRERIIPPISDAHDEIEEALIRHTDKDQQTFQRSMDAVGNRLDKLREDAFLRQIFCHTPEQDDNGEYVDSRFGFSELLDKDVTILFDLGDLRPEAQRVITLLLLSNLWDAVQARGRDGETDYENLTNLIIDEAAPIASTKLVSEQLLPKGRSFGLSLGLMMQFPKQVMNRDESAYDEVLNNIKTKLIGSISIEDGLAKSLAHEGLSQTDLRNRINALPRGEWIAQLPSPSFGDTGPAPFSLKPLPIPAGHPESDEPLSAEEEDHFKTVSLPRVTERTQARYGLAETASESEIVEDDGWGSQSTSGDSDGQMEPTQSSFIGQAASGSSRSEEKESVDSTFDESGSSPVPKGGVTVPDEELQRRGLTHDDVRFLTRVLNVMNRDAEDHGLMDSMSMFKPDFENLDVQRLVDQDLLEKGRACGRRYYTVLPAGRELLGRNLNFGPGQGDLGEKTPHKVGVKLLELWVATRDDVAQVEPYYEYDEETIFDIAGFDADGELVWVGEAELASNNKHAPINDYDKQSEVDANVVWAFNRRETAVEVLGHLADAGRIEHSVSGREARSFSDIREVVESFDAPGLTTIRSFKKMDQELNR